ncbi:hypothetical protein QBC42DRAFT_24162 [Cladorrhinum samala]|uniref:Uncharacterized protein n=1 Tax=Cladorrhinum samala TaxID=585594 RepID=A0AAV9HCT3_9PEZI|nr:hypothetical protein QBC42DRAFT_24162 [Cladorrhinum samala]
MAKFQYGGLALGLIQAVSALATGLAPVPLVDLKAANPFAVLSRVGVTGGSILEYSQSVVIGDIGLAPPGNSENFYFAPPNRHIGADHNQADPLSSIAYNDFVAAYNNAQGRPATRTLNGNLGGGLIITPGVYQWTGGPRDSTRAEGVLTFDAKNDPKAVFIVKIPNSLIATGLGGNRLTTVLKGGANPCRIFWVVGDSVTLTSAVFVGTILANKDITVNPASKIAGALYSVQGSVAIYNSLVVHKGCDLEKPAGKQGPSDKWGPEDEEKWDRLSKWEGEEWWTDDEENNWDQWEKWDKEE